MSEGESAVHARGGEDSSGRGRKGDEFRRANDSRDVRWIIYEDWLAIHKDCPRPERGTAQALMFYAARHRKSVGEGEEAGHFRRTAGATASSSSLFSATS